MDPRLPILLDHDYCTREIESGSGLLSFHLSDRVLRGIFSHMDLKERTKFERCCKRFGSLIPDISSDEDWFDHLSYDYIRPRPFRNDDTMEFIELSKIYYSIFMKSKGIKRLTSEYFDEFQWIGFQHHKPKRKKFINKLLARRPDFTELVIDVSNEWQCGKGFPYQFAIELLYSMLEERCNHVSSLIIYTVDWFMLYEYLLCIIFLVPELTKLTIILTDVKEVTENQKMYEIWDKIGSEVSLCRLHFLWRKVPHFYGFEQALSELEDVRMAPISAQSLRHVISRNPFLSKFELIGDVDLIDEMCSASRLTDFTYYDYYEGRTMDQMTWPLQMFLPEDKSALAKQVFDRFFLMRGHALTSLHINIVQSNILIQDPDLFHSLTVHASNLTSLSLCFHRKSNIKLHNVVKGMKNLKRLRFSLWTPISEDEVSRILSSCPKIRYMEYGILYDPPDPDFDGYSDEYASSTSDSSDVEYVSQLDGGPHDVIIDPPHVVLNHDHGPEINGQEQGVPQEQEQEDEVVIVPPEEQVDNDMAPVVEQIAMKELVWQEAVQQDAVVDLVSESSESRDVEEEDEVMEVSQEEAAGPAMGYIHFRDVESEEVMLMDTVCDGGNVFENEIEVVSSRTPEYLFPDDMVDPLATMRELMADYGLDHEEKYMRKLMTPWRKYARDHVKRKITVIVTATKAVPANISNVNVLKQVLHEIVDFKEYNLSVTFCNPK